MMIDIKTIDDPNIVGELLRNKCFLRQSENDKLAFDLQQEFSNLDSASDKKKELARIIHGQSFPTHDDIIFIDPDFESEDDDRSLDERIKDELQALNETAGATDGEITCVWHNDGDGIILFEIENGPTVINFNSKNNSEWKFVEVVK